MSFIFDSEKCANCKYQLCLEDRRQNGLPGSQAKFLFKQQVALACTFDDFVPGSDRDPQPKRHYFAYLQQFKTNILNAGKYLYGDDFTMNPSALAKLEDDIFEALEAATLWNAAANWNNFMDGGQWRSTNLQIPAGTVARPDRKIAVIRLPRGYDACLLFDERTRAKISGFEHELQSRDLELKLSCPNIVGIRIKPSAARNIDIFSQEVETFSAENIKLLESAYKSLEGTVSGPEFLFALSIQKTLGISNSYQPLLEANILKFLVKEVLHCATFRFNVHVGSSEGSAIESQYRAASLHSLLKGDEPQRAIDRLYTSVSPRDTAQAALEDFSLLPL
jgi:hypothetical protein